MPNGSDFTDGYTWTAVTSTDLVSQQFQLRTFHVAQEGLMPDHPTIVHVLDVHLTAGWRRFFFDGNGHDGDLLWQAINAIRYAYNEAQSAMEYRHPWWSGCCKALFGGVLNSALNSHAAPEHLQIAANRRHLGVESAIGSMITLTDNFREYRVARNAMANLGNILSQRENDGYDPNGVGWQSVDINTLQPVGDFLVEQLLNMNHITLNQISPNPTAGELSEAKKNQTRDAFDDPDPGL